MKPHTAKIALLIGCGFLLTWLLQGCSWTPGVYARYTPPESAYILLQFEYPKTWRVEESSKQHVVYIEDLASIDQDPNIGAIFIDRLFDEVNTPEKALVFETDNAKFFNKVLLLQEETTVAGKPALHLVYRRPPRRILSPEKVKTMTVDAIEDMYYIFDETGTGYYILLRIPESDRNNAFGKGFDHLIATVSIVRR